MSKILPFNKGLKFFELYPFYASAQHAICPVFYTNEARQMKRVGGDV